MILGCSLIFISSWVFATSCVLNRAMKGVHHAIVIFWHGLGGFVIMSTVVLLEGWATAGEAGIRLFQYESRVYFLLLGAALCDVLAVNAGTIAY